MAFSSAFFRSRSFFRAYPPPAAAKRPSPPSIGAWSGDKGNIGGGGDCAQSTVVNAKIIKTEQVISMMYFMAPGYKDLVFHLFNEGHFSG